MNGIQACGIVICALVVCTVFKEIKNDYSLFVRLLITTGIFSISIGIIYPVLTYIDEIAKSSIIYNYIPVLFKALGIAFAVQITSDICKDANESSLAERICFFGKAEILVISLPLIKELFSLSEKALV